MLEHLFRQDHWSHSAIAAVPLAIGWVIVQIGGDIGWLTYGAAGWMMYWMREAMQSGLPGPAALNPALWSRDGQYDLAFPFVTNHALLLMALAAEGRLG